METDEMELDTLGDRKTALFVIISDTDDTFNFVVSILYTQLFNLLCDKADDEYGGRLPVHVRCLLDEFANIGQIPKFEKLIATIRSREISASIILQSQSQLKAIYKDNADTITGNCDTTLFLGGKEKTTLKEMSEILGKETIDSFNTSEELTEVINTWLALLPQNDRILFMRRYWNGETVNTLAQESGVSPANMAKRMYRLRQNLKSKLEKEGYSL